MKELVLIGFAYLLLSKKSGFSIFGVPIDTGNIDDVKFHWNWKDPKKDPLLDEGWIWEKGPD